MKNTINQNLLKYIFGPDAAAADMSDPDIAEWEKVQAEGREADKWRSMNREDAQPAERKAWRLHRLAQIEEALADAWRPNDPYASEWVDDLERERVRLSR